MLRLKFLIIPLLMLCLLTGGCGKKEPGVGGLGITLGFVVPVLLLTPFMLAAKPFEHIKLSLYDTFPDPETRELARAVAKGDIKKIDKLAAKGADINGTGINGFTVLGWAIYSKQLGSFRHLLEMGADPNHIWIQDEKLKLPCSVIHMCTVGVNEFGAEYLELALTIGKGDPNLTPAGMCNPPVRYAAPRDRAKAFTLLYRHGADLLYMPENGNSLLLTASLYKNYKLVCYLLENGADYSRKYGCRNYIGDVERILDALAPGDFERSFDNDKDSIMYFWRSVDFLEKKGLSFTVSKYVKRPSNVDTSPIVF